MATEQFNDNFWDWAAYDLNWINISAQERWLNAKGCPFDCNEKNIERLRNGLAVYLQQSNPAIAARLDELLTTLDKYQNKETADLPDYKDDLVPVTRLMNEIINGIPEIKAREITLDDWVNNGNKRKAAFYAGQEAPALILVHPPR